MFSNNEFASVSEISIFVSLLWVESCLIFVFGWEIHSIISSIGESIFFDKLFIIHDILLTNSL